MFPLYGKQLIDMRCEITDWFTYVGGIEFKTIKSFIITHSPTAFESFPKAKAIG